MSRAQLTSMTADNVVQETLVGSTGNSIKGGSVAPFVAGKNKIINGDFGVWARGTSFTSIGSGNYFTDRFLFLQDGTGTVNATQQTFTPGNTISGYESPYFARLASTSAGTSTYMQFSTKIEDVRTFAGQTATLSFWAKSDSARTSLIYAEQNFGSGGTSSDYPSVGNASTTISWQRFSFTVSIPSILGKTVGTSSYLALNFRLGATTAGAYLDLWGVQLEAGSVATPFTTASGTFQGELALCQRYYIRYTEPSGTRFPAIGYAQTTTAARYLVTFPVQMRVAPSSLEQTGSAGDYAIGYLNTAAVCNSSVPSQLNTSVNGATIQATLASGLTAGVGTELYAQNANAYLGWSAEL